MLDTYGTCAFGLFKDTQSSALNWELNQVSGPFDSRNPSPSFDILVQELPSRVSRPRFALHSHDYPSFMASWSNPAIATFVAFTTKL